MLLLCFDALMLLHGALIVLPLYVLTSTAGSNCADDIIG